MAKQAILLKFFLSRLRIGVFFFATLFFAGTGALTAGELHPTLAQADMPALMPLETVLSTGNPANNYQLAPDGSALAWIANRDGATFVVVRNFNDNKLNVIAATRGLRSFFWAPDSTHILASLDNSGDERTNIWMYDVRTPDMPGQNIFPAPGSIVRYVGGAPGDPYSIFLRVNQRKQSAFDLYKVNLLTGTNSLIEENPGDVTHWIIGDQGKVVARHRTLANGGWILETRSQDHWKAIRQGNVDDIFVPVGNFIKSGKLYFLSNLGQDMASLRWLNVFTGDEEIVYEDRTGDVYEVAQPAAAPYPLFAVSWPGYQRVQFFDMILEGALKSVRPNYPHVLRLVSASANQKLILVRIETDRDPPCHYLVDRASGRVEQLDYQNSRRDRSSYAQSKPIQFIARDGMPINGYITLPVGWKGGALPTIVQIHGGPWERDRWGYDPWLQFLANRGYAVLRINYRGSAGYGRAFREAARHEYGRKMVDDVIDGVDWAIKRGYVDSRSVGLYGGSFGGYSALMALARAPGRFKAAVVMAAITDMKHFLENRPPEWASADPLLARQFGDFRSKDDQAELLANSPISLVKNINTPLIVIHGANDIRVPKAQARQLVEKMRARGGAVEYVEFPNEGHSLRNWAHQRQVALATEALFARMLGGRQSTSALVATAQLQSEPESQQPTNSAE